VPVSAKAAGSRRPASGLVDPETLAGDLASLEQLDLGELRVQFRNRTGRIAPARISRPLLLRVLAYRIQADAFGDLRTDVRRMLEGLASASGTDPSRPGARSSPSRMRPGPRPGTVLAREWQGRMEQVLVLQEGSAWNGTTYASLSAVALAMTGTKWNGHRFFGLRDKAGLAATCMGGAPGDNGSEPRGISEDQEEERQLSPTRQARGTRTRRVALAGNGPRCC